MQHRKLFEEFCTQVRRSKEQDNFSARGEEIVNLLKDATLAVEPRIVKLRQTTKNHDKAIIAENCSLVQA